MQVPSVVSVVRMKIDNIRLRSVSSYPRMSDLWRLSSRVVLTDIEVDQPNIDGRD